MHARRALLRKLAAIRDWDAAGRASFGGEWWLESRNTVYRFQDGICLEVTSNDARGNERARALVGMRVVGWLSAKGAVFSDAWQIGACAVLWRPSGARAEETMAMTSATRAFTRNRPAAHLQAVHDRAPPTNSQTFRRAGAPVEVRPKLPSSSYRSR